MTGSRRLWAMALAGWGVVAGMLASCVGGPVSAPGAAPTMSAAAEPIRGMIGVGTWATRAEFRDIRVTQGERVLFSSDFSEGLEGWQALRGTWDVKEGVLRQTGDEEDTQALIGDPDWCNYTLTLKARKLGGKEGFLIRFATPDGNTRSWWNLGGWGNTEHAFQGPATSDDRIPGRIETGRWYDIRLELVGNTIRGYLDGRLVQTATQAPATHTLVFGTEAAGERKAIPEWGLDTSWPSPENMTRGLLYMGREQVDVVRVAFPVHDPLAEGALTPSAREEVDKRARIASLAGDKPWTVMPHQEGGVHPWYKNGDEVIVERWVQAMAAAQRRFGKTWHSVEPFNEPDYGWNQGTLRNLNDILGALRAHPDFAGARMSGPSTLNSDAARTWYEGVKARVDRGTTHALAGSMTSYIDFFETAIADGKAAENPEAHNLAEVIAGAEYGLHRAIWWGTAELARGEFVKASDGMRLAYGEDRLRWSAAAVYRAPDGTLQAFAGCSERQGETTTYRFVSRDRPVFFNGDGPRREFTVPVRRHWDVLVNITWGEDVPPKIGGTYVIVNRKSGKVLAVTGADTENGAAVQQMGYTHAAHQQWEVAPFVAPTGDQSYFTVRARHSGRALDTADWNLDEGGRIQQWGNGDGGAQHWFFEYAGDSFFYIRSSWSGKCLGPAGTGEEAPVRQFSRTDDPGRQWRLVPVGNLRETPLDSDPPACPVGLTARGGKEGVVLRWTPNPEEDVTGYTVLRAAGPAGPYEIIARGVTAATFTDVAPEAQRHARYVVRAVDASLNRSAFSTEAKPE